jgi:hypothetical protein
MSRKLPGPYDPDEMQRFLATFMYEDEAFLVDEVIKVDVERREIEARLDTTRSLPYARHQRVSSSHPAHVAGGDIIMATASLGCLHAWFFYGCRWDEGWTAFGNRIHHADFRALARIGPPLQLRSRETRSRAGARRLVLRYDFEFRQAGTVVYYGDQTAMFVKDLRQRESGRPD